MNYLAATSVASLLVARRALRNWGATKAECAAVWPGDESVNGPARSVTHAVTIHAPTEQVWRWLVQIGQNRGGVYGYEKLEDLLGIDVPHADCIKPRWQHLTEGDEVDLPGRSWLGSSDTEPHTVATVVPGQTLVLLSGRRRSVWSFHVRPQGTGCCRLVSRSLASRTGAREWASGELFAPVSLLATRKLLLGIKARAESVAAAASGAEPTDAHLEMR